MMTLQNRSKKRREKGRSGSALWLLQLLWAWGAVYGISCLKEQLGLTDTLLLQKSLLSLFLFAAGFVLVGRMAEDWQKNRCLAFSAQLLSAMLCFTELLGTGLRFLEAGEAENMAEGTQLLAAAGGLTAAREVYLDSWQSWVCTIFTAVALSAYLEPFFYRLGELLPEKTEYRKEKTRILPVFLKSWFFLFLGYLPCFLAFYPGLYCYDMTWQWDMYWTGNFSTHHPLLHTYLCGWLFEVGNTLFGSYNAGLALQSLLQIGILTGCMAFAAAFLAKWGLPWKIRAAVMAFYLLFPFFQVLGISTTKDTIFGGLFLAVFVCICDMTRAQRVYRGKALAGFLTAAVLMGTFRNNASYGLLLTVLSMMTAWLIMRGKGRHEGFLPKLSLILCLSVAGSAGVNGGLEHALHASKGSVAEMLSVPMQQMARTYVYHREELTEEEKEALTLYLPRENLEAYKYYVSDPVKAGFQIEVFESGKDDFIRLWMSIGRRFPAEYVRATLLNTMGLWYLGGDSSCYMAYEMKPSSYVWQESRISELKRWYLWFQNDNLKEKLPVFSLPFYTSFYSWAVVICGGLLIGRRRYRWLTPVGILLGYLISLAPGPCILVRYMAGIMLCVPVLWSAVFYGKGEEYNKDGENAFDRKITNRYNVD